MKTGSLVVTVCLAVGIALAAPNAAPAPPQTPDKAPTVTALVASPSPSTGTQQVTLTVSVRPREGDAEVPTGMVEFFDAASSIALAPLMLREGETVPSASIVVTLSAGPHPLGATYKGDARFDVSLSSPLMHIVDNP